jgi:methylmalonyl-CoA mutase N-terminal domain/subunit
MRDRFGARSARSQMLRVHTQTAGVQLTAQQAEVNLVRVAIQVLAATLGGTQSLHANAFDEALALPSEKAARLALRTQQVVAHETDVPLVADPLGGSWFIESLTERIEQEAEALITRVDDMGGAVAAIDDGFQKQQIELSAYDHMRRVERDERIIVGVNRFTLDEDVEPDLQRVDDTVRVAQVQNLERVRAERDAGAVTAALDGVASAAAGDDNLLVAMRRALRTMATVGEVCDVLRAVFGSYRPPAGV